MGLVTGIARQVPGIWHIARGRARAGTAWFTAFVLAANFGLLAPAVWPGAGGRAARAILCGAAALIWWLHRRNLLRRERRRDSPVDGAGPAADRPR